jgi:hypothetical protein
LDANKSCESADRNSSDSREASSERRALVVANVATVASVSSSWPAVGSTDDAVDGRLKTEGEDELDDEVCSESTDNYFTELDPANGDTVDDTLSYSQPTVAYWNHEVDDERASYDNDSVDCSSTGDLEKNSVQQNSAQLTVTKTLTSVYNGQLSGTVDCKLICDNAVCIVPVTSTLDGGVDLHPLSRVLQQVGSPAVERPPLEMTFVR